MWFVTRVVGWGVSLVLKNVFLISCFHLERDHAMIGNLSWLLKSPKIYHVVLFIYFFFIFCFFFFFVVFYFLIGYSRVLPFPFFMTNRVYSSFIFVQSLSSLGCLNCLYPLLTPSCPWSQAPGGPHSEEAIVFCFCISYSVGFMLYKCFGVIIVKGFSSKGMLKEGLDRCACVSGC